MSRSFRNARGALVLESRFDLGDIPTLLISRHPLPCFKSNASYILTSMLMVYHNADTKNSIGILNMGVREVAHNAVSFYWNPLDGPAKVRFDLLTFLNLRI
jgi:hypothetical protein